MIDQFNTPEMLNSRMDRQQHRVNIFKQLTAFGAVAGNKDIAVIDMSYWQDHTRIDYDKLCEQVDGVILRGTYSIWKDTRFDIHYENFSKRGLPIGSYPYLVGNQTPQAQANAFYNAVGGKELKLGVWADIEDRRPETKLNRYTADKFMGLTDDMFNRRTEVYTGVWAWYEIMRTGGHSHRLLWIANYYVNEPAMPKGGDWLTWWLWQHTDRARYNGYYGNVDSSKFNGTNAEFEKWAEEEQEEEPTNLAEAVMDLQARMERVERKLNL